MAEDEFCHIPQYVARQTDLLDLPIPVLLSFPWLCCLCEPDSLRHLHDDRDHELVVVGSVEPEHLVPFRLENPELHLDWDRRFQRLVHLGQARYT